jgi:YgiT-type zinc finger domain-containing protein
LDGRFSQAEETMTCVICKNSQTRPGQVSVTLERGPLTLVFKDVPAEVCENCGEQYIDDATTARLLSEAEKAAAAGVQVEVRTFAAA